MKSREQGLALAQPRERRSGRKLEGFLQCRLDAAGRFTYADPELIDLCGCDELVGQSFSHFVHPADQPALADRFQQALVAGGGPRNAFRFCGANGQIHHLKLISRPFRTARGGVGLNVALTGVTDELGRDQLSAAERYRLLVESSQDILCTLDLDLRFTYASPSITALLGYGESELLGASLNDILAAEDAALVRADLTETLAGDDLTGVQLPQGHLELSLASADGRAVWVEVKRSFIRDEGGRPVGIVAVGRDITERKAEEVERRKLELQIVQFQKLESLGTLAGGIVHDFNNLLMGIQGNVSLMLLEAAPGSRLFERLKSVETYVERGADLTRQLLGFARGGKYEPKPRDLNALLNESLQLFGRTHKEIVLKPDFDEQLHAVEVDRGQIEQVLLNIFVNAWQAMPEGGTLGVRTENVTLNGRQARSLQLTPGRYARLEISDTGCGMDEATRLRVFEPFFTTKAMGHGTGLGLASAYGIVLNHGGIITVKSRLRRGTSFVIYLPVCDRSAAGEDAPPAGIVPEHAAVLLVDDEAMILEVGAEMLEQLGCRVVTAAGGREALEIYAERPADFDLVLLDMIMPEMSGGETYDRLKQINPDVRVILATGYSCTGQAAEIMRRGCNGFMQKPFNLQTLSRKLHELLARACPGAATTDSALELR